MSALICVVLEIEHLQRQFTAGDDHGPVAGDEAFVDILAPQAAGTLAFGNRLFDGFVNCRIEQLDDHAVHLETMRHEDHVFEDGADDFGNGCLAVAGRAVNQDGGAGIYRRSEAGEEAFGDDQILEGIDQQFAAHPLVGDFLADDALLVGLQGNRRRSEILAQLQRLKRISPTGAA